MGARPEGWGLPAPWHLKDNCVMFEHQPCMVSDFVRAVNAGRWPGTMVVPVSEFRRVMLYIYSTLLHVFLPGVLLASIGVLLFRWITA